MRTPKHITERILAAGHQRKAIGAPGPLNLTACHRVDFEKDGALIYGWPSRGGVIVLTHATALDFDYLGLDTVTPPLVRENDQDTEDEFCQQLLRFGARWFDSQKRFMFICDLLKHDPRAMKEIKNEYQPPPSAMERRWVSVGIEEHGFWVLEYETLMPPPIPPLDHDNLLLASSSQVRIARTMVEKCKILESLGARFYKELGEYDGLACLDAWATKTHGEFGALVTYEDHHYCGRYR